MLYIYRLIYPSYGIGRDKSAYVETGRYFFGARSRRMDMYMHTYIQCIHTYIIYTRPELVSTWASLITAHVERCVILFSDEIKLSLSIDCFTKLHIQCQVEWRPDLLSILSSMMDTLMRLCTVHVSILPLLLRFTELRVSYQYPYQYRAFPVGLMSWLPYPSSSVQYSTLKSPPPPVKPPWN